MKKYNFFLDIDGTLLPVGKKKISDAVFSAILKAKEAGSSFFINTARPRWLVPSDVFPPEIFDGVCSGCGTHIEYHGRAIFEGFLENEKVVKIVSELEKKDISDVAMIVECFEKDFYYGKEMPWLISVDCQKVSSSSELRRALSGYNVQKLCFNKSGKEYPEGFFDALKNDFEIMIHPSYAEAAPIGFNKGNAIRSAEKALGLPHETTVAIGDSMNDADMLRYAAVSVAMGNATESVKAMCDLVTDTSDNDGVAKAILRLIGEES